MVDRTGRKVGDTNDVDQWLVRGQIGWDTESGLRGALAALGLATAASVGGRGVSGSGIGSVAAGSSSGLQPTAASTGMAAAMPPAM